MADKAKKQTAPGDGYDWAKIRSKYVTTKITYRALAAEFGCSESQLAKRAAKEKWRDARQKHRKKVERKTEEKIANRNAEKQARDLTRVADLAFDLLDRIDRAIQELDKHVLTLTEQRSYKELNKQGATVQVTENREKLRTVRSTIKTDDMKRISTALKDVRDIITNGENAEDGEKSGVVLLPAVKDHE